MSVASTDSLVNKWVPYLFFTADEPCFPVSIESFLKQCLIHSTNDPRQGQPANSLVMYQMYQAGITDKYLDFIHRDWAERLASNVRDAICYARVLPGSKPGGYLIIYWYLYSHTTPYPCCGCLCPLPGAHKADLKFIAVEVTPTPLGELNLDRVYFGAHGVQGGEWRQAADVQRYDGHPIAFISHGDHSTYPEASCHPRILGLACDRTKGHWFSRPKVVQVYGEKESGFNPATMGWCYFPGKMSTDGISSPANQWWFDGNLPTVSNSWWKRLFCSKFW